MRGQPAKGYSLVTEFIKDGHTYQYWRKDDSPKTETEVIDYKPQKEVVAMKVSLKSSLKALKTSSPSEKVDKVKHG